MGTDRVEQTPILPVFKWDHTLGPATAPVTLIEYGDYECPASGRVHLVTQELLRWFRNHLRFAYRHFPLMSNQCGVVAAQAAEAAAAQGRFWQMHDLLFAYQQCLDDYALRLYARQLDLDFARFERELADGVYRERVEEMRWHGLQSHVELTPTFFINGLRYTGANDLDDLLVVIEDAGFRITSSISSL